MNLKGAVLMATIPWILVLSSVVPFQLFRHLEGRQTYFIVLHTAHFLLTLVTIVATSAHAYWFVSHQGTANVVLKQTRNLIKRATKTSALQFSVTALVHVSSMKSTIHFGFPEVKNVAGSMADFGDCGYRPKSLPYILFGI